MSQQQEDVKVHTYAPDALRAIDDEFYAAYGSVRSKEPESDLGNARRFVMDHAGDVRYVPAWRRWFIHDGAGYREDTQNRVTLLASGSARAIEKEIHELVDGDAKKRRLKHALSSQNEPKIRAMIDLAGTQPEIVASPAQFDADPDLLGVANGVVDLRTGKLVPSDVRSLTSKRVAAPFHPDAECPTFMYFLECIMGGRDDYMRYVQSDVGYSLSGHTGEQTLFLCIGTGANGKTTLLEALLDLFADYGARTPAEALLLSRLEGAQIPNDIARLAGKRIVVATEIEQGRRLNEARVKEITGGDTLTARFMRGEWFDFRPQFKVWLAGNHLPRIHGADHGIWRRLRLIEFSETIAEADQDRRLPEKLRDELPGILRWAIDGARDWYRSGLATPQRVRDATEQYRQGEDVLGQFLAERCAVESGQQEPLKDLAKAYAVWAEANREREISTRNLGAWLEERGFKKARGTGNVVVIQGVRLKA